LTPLPLVLVANAAIGKQWAHLVIGVLTGLVAGALFLFGALDLAGAPMLASDLSRQSKLGLDIGLMATGLAAAALMANPVRQRLARVLPFDPDNPVHAVALVLAVILLGTQVVTIAFTDVLASNQAQPPLSLGDLVLQETPFLILAVVGVGIFLRRDIADGARRLGLVLPTWWQVPLALGAAGVFFAFGQTMDTASQALTPQLAHRVQSVTQHLFGNLNNPVGIAALAIVPAICEEILFRGALQPRLGLVVTAVLFTSIHTEYGLSLDALAVLIIALGLGLIRKYANTTSSALCHASYNLLAGIGIGGAFFTFAAAGGFILVGLAIYGARRSRVSVAASP
jgi:membrane protease YdiL (CAAX protease family)